MIKNRSNKRRATALVVLASAALIAAACGDNKSNKATTVASTAAASTTAAATTAAPTTAAPTTAAPGTTGAGTTAAPATSAAPAVNLDVNGDGKVQFGLAIPGPKDDGAYYQALVDGVAKFTKAHGFPDAIVVDKIEAEQASQAMSSLAEQNVDVMVVGASEIAGPLKDLTEKYPKIFWYCNCGAGFQQLPGLAQTLDDGSEISFTGGYATGLVMKAKGITGGNVAFIGCCDLGFEKEAYMAFELGLKAVDSGDSITYYKSGSHQYDFDNTANATAAYNTAKAAGSKAIYPYLGGAHEPLVKLANQDGLITMSAGRSNACDRTDLKYDIAIRFDGGDYILSAMQKILDGTFKEGQSYTFHVGVDPEPGAVICNATPDEKAAMDAVYKDIAAGKYKDQFGQIKGKAYSG